MKTGYGSQSMVNPLKRVVVRRPTEAFGNADPNRWHYTSRPNLTIARQEHQKFVDILAQAGVEIIYHDVELPEHADAIFVHDPVIVTDQGAILLRMGKPLRRGEEDAIEITLKEAGIPIHFRLHGEALAEGGDLLWIDRQTLAVGLGFRTNEAGFNQLRQALPEEIELIPVQLPYFKGPDACLHLMSFISLVDHKLAVVYPPLMPVPFWQLLNRRGFRFVEVPENEFWSMGPNVLAIAPGQLLMLENNPQTRQRLQAAGCEVATYRGHEISLKAEGGATCLTRPVLRSQK